MSLSDGRPDPRYQKPHHQCFLCFRKMGIGCKRTARIFGVKEKRVLAWFKKRGIPRSDKLLSWAKPKPQKKPRPPKKVKIKLTALERIQRSILRKSKRKKAKYLRKIVWRMFATKTHSKTAVEITGLSKFEFRCYIESKLRFGMTIENYGDVWDLDHIVACKHFDLSYPDQIAQCFHYTNYQPLFCHENHRKGAKKLGSVKGGGYQF